MTPPPQPSIRTDTLRRLRLEFGGAVQGVGFRPMVHRLARRFGLDGWVANTTDGLVLEVEGPAERVELFEEQLPRFTPPASHPERVRSRRVAVQGRRGFLIVDSVEQGEGTAVMLPDQALCRDCLNELLSPANRRYLYPFTHCTVCGPRYSIQHQAPFDRAHTVMDRFPMCGACEREYNDPDDRRFHSQANTCPECGPQAALWDRDGTVLGERAEAIQRAARCLVEGGIVALKAMGGFQLLVRADDPQAVTRLRDRKGRDAKPLALMVPDVHHARRICRLDDAETSLLLSAEAPIVVLDRLEPPARQVAEEVAPGLASLGVMVPSTPLHHLLFRHLDIPVVATSGNLHQEPLCHDNLEAVRRLSRVADRFLVHNRDIVNPVDDSVVQSVAGDLMILRRARGYAPMPLRLGPAARGASASACWIAVGGHDRNTVACRTGNVIQVSPHLGDLQDPRARSLFEHWLEAWAGQHAGREITWISDVHPDYASTLALGDRAPRRAVQHHLAHIAACMVEHRLQPPVLGIAWDGTGLGTDGAIWGGETFICRRDGVERMAHLRPFKLPGGEAAVREPRRAAAGLLQALRGHPPADRAVEEILRPQFEPDAWRLLQACVSHPEACVATTSMGRLLDAIAALLGLCPVNRYQGEAAMRLEAAASRHRGSAQAYPFTLEGPELDWRPMVLALLEDLRVGAPPACIAACVHETLAAMIVRLAQRGRRGRIALGGGCFQNRLLTRRALECLEVAGFKGYVGRRIPPNDGGLSVGQVAAVSVYQWS